MISYQERLRQLRNAAPSTPAATAAAEVAHTVRALLVEVLALPEEQFDPARSFKDLGLSSLLAVRLLDRINRRFGLRLGVEVLFNYGDAERLTAHIAALCPSPVCAPAASVTPVPKPGAGNDAAIAIIGYAGKFAAAPDAEALWQALAERRSLLSEQPTYRRQNSGPAPRAGFLVDAERFDAAFFGISPREGAAMDPVQRQFLEQAWRALEHAGLTRQHLTGRRVGVYAGAAGSGYQHCVPSSGKAADAYVMTGNLASMTAARVAYFLDLDGPAVTVDTACSSSLTALHLACQALRSGEIELAVAGGASLFADPRAFEAMSRAGMTSPSQSCHAFDERADGIVVAEGAGCVILKTLARAEADGDRIDAVIRAVGVNQDGRSNGITAPSALAQAKLLRAVLKQAGLAPADLDLIETHGTGTRLGDPIEAAALHEVHAGRPAQRPLRVAALKACLGHASEAAGIAGLIATLEALRHQCFPPIVGFEQLNRHIAESAGKVLCFSGQAETWPSVSGRPRRAALSSFGLSGSNAHLILEQAPAPAAPPCAAAGPWPFLLSAATPDALARRKSDLTAWLREQHDAVLPAVARTLLRHREHLNCRWAVCAGSIAELRALLDSDARTDNARQAEWLAGQAAAPDWPELPAGAPLALPAYPFHGPRLWGGETLPEQPSAAPEPDALLGQCQADGVFVRRFRADEALVADHRVAGQALVHAGVLLEICLAAAERCAPGRVLSELAWLKPLAVAESVSVEIRLEQENLSITAGSQLYLNAQLRTADNAAPAPCKPEALWDSLPAGQNAAGPTDSEMFLGPSFPGPDRIRADGQQALAFLEQAPGLPGLLDCAIRSAAAVLGAAESGGFRLRFPARLSSLRRFAALPDRGLYCHARRRHSGPARSVEAVDVTVYDRHGAPLLELAGLTLAAAAEAAPEISQPEIETMAHAAASWRVLWQETPMPAHSYREQSVDCIIAAEQDALANRLAQAFPQARRFPFGAGGQVADALAERPKLWFFDDAAGNRTPELFDLIQALARAGYGEANLGLRIVTRSALSLPDDSAPHHPAGAALLGLAKAAAREFPSWQIRLIDCDSEAERQSECLQRLLHESGDPLGEPVVWRGARRYLQRLAPLDGHGTSAAIRLNRQAHVIILGGMGRLGRVTARYLAQRYQARLSLIGRSAPNAEHQAVLAGLRQAGGEAAYFSADIGSQSALDAALDQAIAAFGPAALLIQATVDPAFARLERAVAEEFNAALRPKISGLQNLGRTLAARPIDALVLYSSIGAFTGFPANDGQASYSAACNFEAAYALQLQQSWPKPLRIIHWGLWNSGDYGQEALARLQDNGLYPMDPQQLGAALETLLAAGYPQLVHASLAARAWLDLGATPSPACNVARVEAARQALAAPVSDTAPGVDFSAAQTLLRQRITAGLAAGFAARGFVAGQSYSRSEAGAQLAVLPRHRPLAEALLNMAVRHGLAEWQEEASCFRFLGSTLNSTEDSKSAELPGLQASLNLLQRCLDALPEVLAGSRPATDVLFPEGSMAWVEPIYRDQPVLAGCGQRLAQAVSAAVARGGGRILEIGAGTGATAGLVLDALDAADLNSAAHYLYTDISRAFVRHGQQRFGARLAGAEVLDISRPPETQGIALAAWDVVIASNVLHATADIRRTLSHVAVLLAPGGMVLINEMVEPDDFATLTFGLLDGWWESQDSERRLADGPILGLDGWQQVLRSVGLYGHWAYDWQGRAQGCDGGQAVILAFRAPAAALSAPQTPLADSARTASPGVPPDSSSQRGPLESALREILAGILGVDAGNLERERPFMEIGVDSLIAPQIAEEVQARLGCPLRVTDIYKYGQLAALAEHLANAYPEQLRLAEPPAVPAAAAAAAPAAAVVPAAPRREAARPDDIAIIGLSARFAGAPDLDALWQLLCEGRSAIKPLDRFDLEPWFDPAGGPNKTYARWGGFLDDYDRFDPYFFNITPAEAEVMDPQQRVLMEETWKALEHAGIDPTSLSAARCGLFVGASSNNYQAEGAPGLRTLGGSMAILSARMAYVLNLRGPNFPIDTGCSSSLVALHQACQSLRSGECDLALAGGVSVNLISPDIYLYLSDAGMIAHDGVGRSFDDQADGFVPGEGAGIAVLKRLSDALADGDRIEAVIAASGINQDGRTAGLTAPSADAQTALTRQIYQQYGLNPADFGMIEAHGTGTRLGDPIEVQALTETFRHYTERRGGCAIGSIKTNIGHTMAAAGMAGIAKAVLALRHGKIPASLNFSRANRHIDFADSPFFVPTATVAWPEGRAPLAAVSSFGFSGTNAHIVLRAGDPALAAPTDAHGPWLFAVSARDAAALQRRLLDLAAWLAEQSAPLDLARVADTLARGRAHWRYRCAVVAGDAETLTAALRRATTDTPTAVAHDHIPQRVTVPATPEGLQRLAEQYRQGDLPDWQSLFGPRKPPLALPCYPFARERFWTMRVTPPAGSAAPASATASDYPIDASHPLLQAHRVGGSALLPGTLSLELLRGDAEAIEAVGWLRPLSSADTPTRLRVEDGSQRVLLNADGQSLAEGRLGRMRAWPALPPAFNATIKLSGDELYARFAQGGFDYGPVLRVIEQVEIGQGAARARLRPPAALRDNPLLLGAALLDGALQTAAAIGYAESGRQRDEQWVPHRLGALQVRRRLSGPCQVFAWLEQDNDPDRLSFNVLIQDEDDRELAAFLGMSARQLTRLEPETWAYYPSWQACADSESLPAPAAIALHEDTACWESVLSAAFPAAQRITLPDADETQLAATLSKLPSPLLVLHALAPAAAEEPSTVANTLAAADPLPAVAGARALARALLLAGRQSQDRLLTVAAADPNAPNGTAAAAVAGLYRGLQREAPELDARVLLADSENTLKAVLAQEITRPAAADPFLYYRGETRQVQAWQAAAPPSTSCQLPKGDGTVVISGGLGGLGLALAERLAAEGAAKLALLARSAPDSTIKAALARIEALGATVLTVAVDVGEQRALARALNTVRETLGPISAVYHLAGVLRDGFLRNQDRQALREVFQAKVRGALLLDLLTRDDPLQAMLLFGSTAAVFGSIGQADYGAANAFLAAFAAARRARGANTLCVHWPLWAEGGMQPPESARAFLAGLGMQALPSALGFDYLAQLATSTNSANALLLHGDSALFERLQAGAVTRAGAPGGSAPLLPDAAFDYLCQILAAVVKLPRERIEADALFEELGIDSIAIMKLNRQMETDLGPIAKTLFFEYRTPAALAAHLQQAKPRELAAYLYPQSSAPAATETPVETGPAVLAPAPAPAAQNQAIAIVGIAGLYPQAADLEQFWHNLISGRDCIDEIPPERWPLNGFYDPDRDRAETSHCKWGGFIADADCFDTRFFGIAPLEAETLDPQARKFLEITWNALEDAGLDPDRMFDTLPEAERRRRACGVFVGVMYGDYQLFGPEEAQHGNLIGPNADYWNIANRVSAFLDLHGPSMAVDTACSSSLSALHLACQAIRAGDCSMAIAGGVNLCLHPRRHWILSKAGMAASDGRCHSFGAGGDGYVPGEGIGAVVLKPLARAQADGDRIHAVILGSALNHGGRTSGYTVPNPLAQGEVVADALRQTGIDPRSISYLEAHGTGTPLGDPIEIRGLAHAFKAAMPADCAVGSVKGNIGHLESAAGIAGLSKVLLQMRHRQLAPTLHAEPLNPNLDFSGTGFRIITQAETWQYTPLRAGLSSFGAGGANAHVILEAYGSETETASPGDSGEAQLLLLSARDNEALRRHAGQLAAHLTGAAGRQQTLSDIAHTLSAGRKAFGARMALFGNDREQLAAVLQAFADGHDTPPNLWHGQAAKAAPAAVADDPAALAAAWVAGAPPPKLPGRRVTLPGYPFAKRRLWVKRSLSSALPVPATPKPVAEAIPFAPAPQRFSADRPPLADHRIGGRALLPGAFSLWAALQAAPQPCLREVRWPQPGLAAPGEDLIIDTQQAAERIEVHAGDGACLLTARPATADTLPDAPTSQALPAQAERRLDAAHIYAALASAGAEYGPSLQVLTQVECGDAWARARLRPESSAPALLDAVFQLCFALIPEQLSGQALLPAQIGAITLAGDLSRSVSVAATRRAADADAITVDFQLLDGNGTVLAWLDAFRAQRRRPAAAPEAEWPLRLLRPEWRTIASASEPWLPAGAWVLAEQPDDALAQALAVHWQCRCSGLDVAPSGMPEAVAIVLAHEAADLIDSARQSAAVLESLRGLLRAWSRAARPPALLLLQRAADDAPGPQAAACSAFVRAAARERQDWPVVTLALPESVWQQAAAEQRLPEAVLTALPPPPGDDPVPAERRWHHGLLQQRVLVPVELPPSTPPWRDGEVLLIAGCGGLGGLLARHVASYAKVSFALLGRSPSPNAAGAEAMAALRATGRPVAYFQADLADAEALGAALSAASTALGPIDWLVHSALVMGDASIGELSAETLQQVLAPKTLGLAHLCTQIQPRRGLLLFSSANALTANPGQAAYAAASAFVDAAAASLPYPAYVCDWGFWGETGAVADPAHQAQLAKLGVFPIRNREGLGALETVVACGVPRVAVLRVADRLLAPMGVETQRPLRRRSEAPVTLTLPATHAAEQQQQAAERFADPAVDILNGYAARRLWQALADAGVDLNRGELLNAETLRQNLNARSDYLPLLAALAELLQRAGFCDSVQRSTGRTAEPTAVAEQRQQLEIASPASAPTLALLETCLSALGEIVSGRRDAASVLFGGGDAAVAALYRGNPVVDHFQSLVAAAVAGAVRAADTREAPLQLLEVGAGTGGTTGFVLAALENLPNWHYRITDLSATLVKATAERLDPSGERLSGGRLDVTLPLERQGVAAGSIDVLIAANVLHATPDLLTVLANLKSALKPGGLLILNEATSRQDINTLTFGLTPGWWAYRDAERRCPHGPLLDPPRWRATLQEAGYSVSACYGLPLAEGGEHPLQSVLIASADAFAPVAAAPLQTQASSSASRPTTSDGNQARSGLEQALRDLIAETLRLTPEELGLDDSFADHGADSILSVELVRRLNAAFGIDLKSTALFNYATVRELAAYLAREHGVAGAPGNTEESAEDGKQRSRRLREVIERRRAAAPVNREAEFWQRESGPEAVAESPTNAAPADLDDVLRRLEAGTLSVAQAMELNYVDE